MEGMNTELIIKILERVREKYSSPKTKECTDSLQNLVCPACGKSSGYIYFRNPWKIKCNKLNSCGATSSLRDLFPDLFQTIEKLCPPVPHDPHRPARAYLESRGLRQSLLGLSFFYWKQIRKTASGGVMFDVGRDSNGKTIFNGRLFNPPAGEGKTHNTGSTSGVYWCHPGRKINPDEPVYVTEGVLDALSLIEMGVQAIAVLSSGQDPSKLRLDGFKKLVAAFDSDKAGCSALSRWMDFFKNRCSISGVLPDKGRDWNDILMEARGQNVKEYFEKRLPEYSFNADLVLCKTAQDYLDKFLSFKGFSPQLFAFGGVYYYAKAQHKGAEFFAVPVSDFTVETDYYLLDESIKDRRVYRYGLSVYPKGRKRIQAVFEAKELSTTKELVTAMLARARCAWSGDSAATNLFCGMIVRSNARELRQLQSLGYDEKTNSYVFPEFMIDPSGKMVAPSDGLYSFPGGVHVRPVQVKTSISPSRGIPSKDLWSLLLAAWGNRAAVSVAWLVSSWFVHRVRSKTGFFPFLSLFHDPQTGKSALMRALNRMQGVDEEGLTMTKADTIKGLTRKLGQKNSLFTGLSEVNRDENSKLPIDAVLAWYDGSPLATRAAFTSGNEVVEIPFLGSVMFCQNEEPFLTQPQKERVISLRFEKERMSPDTRAAFMKLVCVPPCELAHFFVDVMRSRELIESTWFDEFNRAKNELYAECETSNRLVDTHGLVLGFHRVLCRVLGIDYDLKGYVVEIMKNKYISSQSHDSTPADTFFAEVASVLRECKVNNKRGFLEYIDVDLSGNRLWLHVHDLIDKTGRTALTRYPAEKFKNALKNHPSFIKNNSTHRFKEFKAEMSEYVSYPKIGWCFDLGKIGHEFDFDIRSIEW